jgi:RNA polymerase sigma factor (sigma-70 family)
MTPLETTTSTHGLPPGPVRVALSDVNILHALTRNAHAVLCKRIPSPMQRQQAVEEVVQATAIRALKIEDRYDPERGSVLAYLIRILNNIILEYLRDEAKQPRSWNPDYEPAALEEITLDRSELEKAIARHDKTGYLRMHYLDELDYRQIAAQSKKAENTIRQAVRRTLARVAREMRAGKNGGAQ